MYKYSEEKFQQLAKKGYKLEEVQHIKDDVYHSYKIGGNSMEYVSIGDEHSKYGEKMLA